MWEGDQSVFILLWASDVSLTRSNDLSHLIQLTSISNCVHRSRERRLPSPDGSGTRPAAQIPAEWGGRGRRNGGESNKADGAGHSGLAEMCARRLRLQS